MKPAVPEFDTTVVACTLIAEDALRIDIARTDGAPFPPWDAGSHIDLLLPTGLERQYSLCGNPDDREVWTVVVLRERPGRGGSTWLHDHLEPGAALRVRGPSNHFGLEPAAGYRFVAGGIGITAILPMVRDAHARGRPWQLDYAARSSERVAFGPELDALGGTVRVHIGAESGRLDVASIRPEPGELVYACGPVRLLDALSEHAATWAPDTLRVERFEAIHPAEPARNEPFDVELVLSGETVGVGADESLLDAVERAGVFVLSSCREGTCGTCETVVVAGAVDHRDSILTEAERRANDRMMICVSRAASADLALEL